MCMSGENGDTSFHDGIAERAQTTHGELTWKWKWKCGEYGYESHSDDIVKCKGGVMQICAA